MDQVARPKRGEIWYIENNKKSSGHEIGKTRPAIIVSSDLINDFSSVVEVVYLTTAPKKDMPTHVQIRSAARQSTALCEQVSSVDVERLVSPYGKITTNEQNMIDNALLVSLGIDFNTTQETVTKTEDIPLEIKSLEIELGVYKKMYNDLLEKAVKDNVKAILSDL